MTFFYFNIDEAYERTFLIFRRIKKGGFPRGEIIGEFAIFYSDWLEMFGELFRVEFSLVKCKTNESAHAQ